MAQTAGELRIHERLDSLFTEMVILGKAVARLEEKAQQQRPCDDHNYAERLLRLERCSERAKGIAAGFGSAAGIAASAAVWAASKVLK